MVRSEDDVSKIVDGVPDEGVKDVVNNKLREELADEELNAELLKAADMDEATLTNWISILQAQKTAKFKPVADKAKPKIKPVEVPEDLEVPPTPIKKSKKAVEVLVDDDDAPLQPVKKRKAKEARGDDDGEPARIPKKSDLDRVAEMVKGFGQDLARMEKNQLRSIPQPIPTHYNFKYTAQHLNAFLAIQDALTG